MSDTSSGQPPFDDIAPGDQGNQGREVAEGYAGYLIGLGLAVMLTCVSFFVANASLIWSPSVPIALSVLAVAQMAVHLVFFLHLTSGPESLNNTMALVFGVLIVMLLVVGSLFIMSHLNHNMMPLNAVMEMQR